MKKHQWVPVHAHTNPLNGGALMRPDTDSGGEAGGSGFGGGAPTGAAGGDLSGAYPNPSVVDDSHNHTLATLPADVMSNPMTTQDDLIVGGASGVPGRLGKGSDGQVLTVDPTTHHLVWADPAAGSGDVATDTIWNAKGDLAVGTGSDTASRLGVGSDGDVLTADSGETTGVKWAAPAGGGSDLVQVASGAGSVRIPGIAFADRVPSSPNAADDEFDTLSGWTTWGTLNSQNVTDFPSHWHAKKSGSGTEINGIYKAIPAGGMPFTATIKITDYFQEGNFDIVGLFVTDSTPSGAAVFSRTFNSGQHYEFATYSNRTSRSSVVDIGGTTWQPYLRIIVTSSSSVTFQHSRNGAVWLNITTRNPGITIANVGIMLGPFGGGNTTEAVIDFIRFT